MHLQLRLNMLRDLLWPKHRFYKKVQSLQCVSIRHGACIVTNSSPHIGSMQSCWGTTSVYPLVVRVRFPSSRHGSVSYSDFCGHRGFWLSSLHGAENTYHPWQLIIYIQLRSISVSNSIFVLCLLKPKNESLRFQ